MSSNKTIYADALISSEGAAGDLKLRWGSSAGLVKYQPSITSITANTTLTLNQIRAGILHGTGSGTYTLTCPANTVVTSSVNDSGEAGDSYDFALINDSTTGKPWTVAVGTGGSLFGNSGVVTGNTSAQFRLVVDSAAAYSLYRLA